MKLAKRFMVGGDTNHGQRGRTEIVAFRNGYHGSTQGALSIMGDETLKSPFLPLLPDIKLIGFDDEKDLEEISERTCCVIVEPIQGEAGVVVPANGYLEKLAARCREKGALLVFDEIQTGFGRTGKLFAFEHYGVVPDILCLAKALGGGMPLGAFVSSKEIMSRLSHNPPLGHITTFGGHPVCCAAGLAAMQVLVESNLVDEVEKKAALFHELLVHRSIKAIRSKGLLIAVEFENFEFNKQVIDGCIERGVITDWFLFNDKSLRIAPPLIISEEEIRVACNVILNSINLY